MWHSLIHQDLHKTKMQQPFNKMQFTCLYLKHNIKKYSPATSFTCIKLLKGARLSMIGKLPISGSASGPGGKLSPLAFLFHQTNINTAKTKANTSELESSISLL